ncbi:uncharacterized protein LOC134537371 isoform X2 [Bacillus rossius redtenbacheri]|uniref:uncharacterized protein LOC134537371 isoform X2 n=1 Tax=Bacillus rossius redtenbacheri TaxID=93214 RepID=UPI002FDC8C0A
MTPGAWLAAALLTGVAARCPHHEALARLDAERFTGLWNIIKESDNPLAGAGGRAKCKHSIISIPGPETDSDLQARTLTYNSTSRSYDETRLSLKKMKTNHNDGKYDILFSEFNGSRYYVVDTDYDNYAVVWLCYVGIDAEEVIEYTAVLSRRKSPRGPHLSSAYKLLPRGHYRSVDQQTCPWTSSPRS